ncbi:P63C domain-containing protein [Devosia sp. MC521]|uniref:P63C domain-containing protein n=1 Tax=Devosia sp. MC521 TaxID=2759954 RepID=UPI0018F06E6A|nr:P63C domain-containing protein [Devosia sp. MC521]MBJ6986909.1 P63C domain-containing protein [Devosia sp. MC521]
MTTTSIPQAIHDGVLVIGDAEIPCNVLEDGRRVLTQSGVMRALGRARQAKGRGHYDGDVNLPAFLTAKNLKPFIPSELYVTSSQIEFRRTTGGKAFGYPAELLPLVCAVFDDADRAGKLAKPQKHIAEKARMLLRGLLNVGIVALVDEATGYQKVRARDELQKILAAYVSPELLPWAKRFPDSFYENLHRVRGWEYKPGSNARTAYIGKLTNTLIYEQLPTGVLDDLREKNPRDPITKRRKHNHHELLTTDIGNPHLERQIISVNTLLSVSDDWSEFTRLFTKKFPPGPGDLFAPPPSEK